MKISADVVGDFEKIMRGHVQDGERAVTRAMRGAGRDLKTRWRRQVVSAGLGRRLSNTIREANYPQGQNSLGAAALVWSKAPHIVSAHDEATVIRAANGFWLAIPTPAAGRGVGGKRITPTEWEKQRGIELRPVRTKTGNLMLVADDVRIRSGKRTNGTAVRKRGRRRKDGILTGAQTSVIFVLVPQVRLRKRLDLTRDVEDVAGAIPARIVSNWKGLD